MSSQFLQLKSPLGDDALTLINFSGDESISKLFAFHLSMISENDAITPESMIGKKICVRLNADSSSAPRYFHGIVKTFSGGATQSNVTHYSAVIMPWLGLLEYTTDYRIFQDKNVVDITHAIFSDLNFPDFDLNGLKKSYKPRDYCVQYGESVLGFLQRIWAEEGIFYFFNHTADKHILMLADDSTLLKKNTTSEANLITNTNEGHGLTAWGRQHRFYSGGVTKTDYNYETPITSLKVDSTNKPKLAATTRYTTYQYPGPHQTHTEGKTQTQHAFESHEASYARFAGTGSYPSFTPGTQFEFSNPPNTADKGSYVLVSVNHQAMDTSSLGTGSSGTPHFYENTFECLPSATPLRFHAPDKPRVTGPQSAIVVGPAGEEIYTDKYGRVKIQFTWDRKGKKDDHSSCWVRPMQLWAGAQRGTYFCPRIGDEVIVQFLNNDPDRPVIMGSLYNAHNLPPYALPSQQTCSGIKSRSSKGGSAAQANELRFDDKMGNEEIYLHAQKDFNQIVENDKSVKIMKGNYNMTVEEGHAMITATEMITLAVGASFLIMTPTKISIKTPVFSVNE